MTRKCHVIIIQIIRWPIEDILFLYILSVCCVLALHFRSKRSEIKQHIDNAENHALYEDSEGENMKNLTWERFVRFRFQAALVLCQCLLIFVRLTRINKHQNKQKSRRVETAEYMSVLHGHHTILFGLG